MKVFFVASLRSVNKNPELYRKMYKQIEASGAKMVSDMVLEFSKMDVEEFYGRSHNYRIDHYKRTMDGIKKADVVVVEVSEHSMSMGYIVNKAIEASKPVIALYSKGNDPYFFSGIEDAKLLTVEYTENNVDKAIKEALVKVQNLSDVRFNFFVSPRILAYLDWVAQKKMVPRSVFLRKVALSLQAE